MTIQDAINDITDTQCQVIDLSDNNIGDKGAEEIAEALKANKSVTRIDLSGNEIGNSGALDIAEALKANNSVTEIDLSCNEIGEKGALEIAEALKANKSVTRIDLSGNEIGNSGALDIAAALEANKSVTTISLACNEIGDVGAFKIAMALKKNISITKISLSHNNIGEKGALEIAEALKANNSVTTISLACNAIGDVGATRIAEALKENNSVTEIHLSKNNIGSALTQSIISLVNSNKLFQEGIKKESFGEQNINYITNAKYLTFIKDNELYDMIFKANQLPVIKYFFKTEPELLTQLIVSCESLKNWMTEDNKNLHTFLTGLNGSECKSNEAIAIVSKIYNTFPKEKMTYGTLGLFLDIIKQDDNDTTGIEMKKKINDEFFKHCAPQIQSIDQSTQTVPEFENVDTQMPCIGMYVDYSDQQ